MRRVFFSFHYGNDVWRANQVRNAWVTKGNFTTAGYVDSADFEKVKRQGELAIHRWIDNQLTNTSVTVVLLGEETLKRPYVQYEIKKSIEKGNKIIGVKINGLKNQKGEIGSSPNIYELVNGKSFNNIAHKIYSYSIDDGYSNLGKWIEEPFGCNISF